MSVARPSRPGHIDITSVEDLQKYTARSYLGMRQGARDLWEHLQAVGDETCRLFAGQSKVTKRLEQQPPLEGRLVQLRAAAWLMQIFFRCSAPVEEVDQLVDMETIRWVISCSRDCRLWPPRRSIMYQQQLQQACYEARLLAAVDILCELRYARLVSYRHYQKDTIVDMKHAYSAIGPLATFGPVLEATQELEKLLHWKGWVT